MTGIHPRRVTWRHASLVPAITVAFSLQARIATAEPMPSPIDAFGDDVVRAFTEPLPLILYGSAVVSTVVLVPTGADHAARVAVQENIHSRAWGDGAYYGGYVLPLVVPAGLYVTGLVGGSRSFAGAGSAALQALGVTFVTTVILKVGTGRPFPLHGMDRNAPDRLEHPEFATEFSPFEFAGYYAWPSGHTSSVISVAAALSAYSDSVVVPLVSYPIAFAIGTGMIVADRHWVSDVVAGACIGQAIGWSVGAAFRERSKGEASKAARFHFVPLMGNVRGLALAAEF